MDSIEKLKIVRKELLEIIKAMKEANFHITHPESFNKTVKMVEDVETIMRENISIEFGNDTNLKSQPIIEVSQNDAQRQHR